MAKIVKINQKWKQYQLGGDFEFGHYGGANLGYDAGAIQDAWAKQPKAQQHSGGLVTLKGAYLAAMGDYWGPCGTRVRVNLSNKKSFDVIICDHKGKDIPWYNKNHKSGSGKVFGHNKDDGGGYLSLIEFNAWNGISSAQSTLKSKGFYGKKIVSIIILGNYKSKNIGNVASFKPKHYKDGQPSRKGYYGPPKNNFPFNNSTGGNCTWYAYGRFCEVAKKVISHGSGNACRFYDKQYFPTCKRGKTAKVGAIICWGYGSAHGEPGHVAFVEEIKNEGTSKEKIRITHSGWSSGWNCGKKGDTWLHKSKNFEDLGWSQKVVFRGFIYNPVDFGSDAYAGSGADAESGAQNGINMQQRIARLYSSDNYQYLETVNNTTIQLKSPIQILLDKIRAETYTKIDSINDSSNSAKVNTIFDSVLKGIIDLVTATLKQLTKQLTKQSINRNTNSIFNISRYLVEAPFVEMKIGNQIIGSYKGTLDKYPNYITGINITKTNGTINEYTIQLVHQIRIGDDPNLLDKVFAQNQFNPITITYGDTDSGQKFYDVNAIITNINMNRDYASARIIYTIKATSAGSYITAHVMNFPAVTDKPSNVIRRMLFSSSLSKEFKQAFPGMSSKTIVDSKRLIPTNDKVLHIEAKNNIDPISYLNYLVSCMSNASESSNKILRKSSYFIFYKDDQKNGARFEIKEITKNSAANSYNAVYEVTIGYPDENNIFSFNVSNDKAWAIMYDKNISAKSAQEYVYTIENNGDVKKYYSPNINSASQQLGERNKNWWSYMVGFPINATLTMRGLLRPAFLTNYIKINVVFYGQKHVTSGLYAITEQQDTLDGRGFRTTFSLVRVGEK